MNSKLIGTAERFMFLTEDLVRFYASSEGESDMLLGRLHVFWYRIVCPGEWSEEKLSYVVDRVVHGFNTFPPLNRFELFGDAYDRANGGSGMSVVK